MDDVNNLDLSALDETVPGLKRYLVTVLVTTCILFFVLFVFSVASASLLIWWSDNSKDIKQSTIDTNRDYAVATMVMSFVLTIVYIGFNAAYTIMEIKSLKKAGNKAININK